MIRINLQQQGPKGKRRKAAAQADPGGGGGGGGGWSGANTLPVLVILLPLAAGAGGSLYVHQGLLGDLKRTEAATRAAEAELARLKPVLDELERFKKDKALLERKLAAIKELEGRRTGPVRIYDELGAIMPAQVWVTSLSEAGMRANLQGIGLDSQSVAVFVSAMERSPYFANVELTGVEQMSYLGLKVKKFTVTCQFRLPSAQPAGVQAAQPAGVQAARPAAGPAPQAR